MEIQINGKKINYEVKGEGKSVVLLHGWLCSLETMEPLAKHLCKNFKVYSIDIIGFGKSELPDKPLNTNDFGDFLNELLKKLKIEDPILIGHSNGGRTIINYAGRNLGKVNKIILIDSAGIIPKRKLKYYLRTYTFKLLKNIFKILPKTEMVNNIKDRALGKFGSSDYKNSPDVLKKTMSIILNEDMKDIMPNIKAPTLLIWGENDTATPVQDGKTMERLIPGSGLIVYKNSGHFSYLDNLSNCLIVLDEFLKDDMKEKK
ncbi:MAG: alpha/beta hydrolase [Clostridiaceae bacterium]|nr:alpha/beta hydrolase [Clostridiaceae bacterium]